MGNVKDPVFAPAFKTLCIGPSIYATTEPPVSDVSGLTLFVRARILVVEVWMIPLFKVRPLLTLTGDPKGSIAPERFMMILPIVMPAVRQEPVIVPEPPIDKVPPPLIAPTEPKSIFPLRFQTPVPTKIVPALAPKVNVPAKVRVVLSLRILELLYRTLPTIVAGIFALTKGATDP